MNQPWILEQCKPLNKGRWHGNDAIDKGTRRNKANQKIEGVDQMAHRNDDVVDTNTGFYVNGTDEATRLLTNKLVTVRLLGDLVPFS